jgi:hypothetical protein
MAFGEGVPQPPSGIIGLAARWACSKRRTTLLGTLLIKQLHGENAGEKLGPARPPLHHNRERPMPAEVNTPDNDQPRAAHLAEVICKGATEQERKNITDWLGSLIAIAEGDGSALEKARHAVEETTQRDVVWPVVKLVGGEIKRHAWEDRSLATRLAGVGVFTALALGGGEAGAGIAALGTAVGVPLWIVFAAGGAFAGTLLDEIQKLAGSDAADIENLDRGESGRDSAGRPTGGMSPDEAFKILGLSLGATESEICDAHKRLMKGVHPDAGGSTYLAAQLNQARDKALQQNL